METRSPELSQALDARWLRGLAVLLFSVALIACAGRTPQEDQVAVEAPSDRARQKDGANESATTLNVVAKGFSLAVAASQINAGTITFSVKKAGAIPHNFSIQGNGVNQETGILKPGETAPLTVDLHPGTYTYKCTVHFHNLLGMKGTLMVIGFRASDPE